MNGTPKPDPFVSGTLTNGRLELVRQSGSTARCGVVILRASLTDNGDSTVTVTFPA